MCYNGIRQSSVSYTHLDVYKRQAKIAHDVDLAFGVAAGAGDDGAADLLKPAVQAARAGKEGVSEADLRDVVRRNAAGGSDAGDALRPGIQVAPGVAGGDGPVSYTYLQSVPPR